MRSIVATLTGLVALTIACEASADRIAVIALQSPYGAAPVVEADALSSHLLQARHRTINHGDASTRLLAGNAGADAAWAATLSHMISQGRQMLTRLDRHGASVLAQQTEDAIRRAGGGAGGPEVLVEWALLERSLALSASSAQSAKLWTQRAAALGPRVALDPLTHPEDELHALAAEVAAAERQPPATLTVRSTPLGAELWVNGVQRCPTPCSASLPPGHHFARVSSPAHTSAVFEIDLGPSASVARDIGLSSAYAGASLEAISSLFADPSRGAEANSALLPVARFLDVDHVIALWTEPSGKLRLVVAPPANGRPSAQNGVSRDSLASTADTLLTPREGDTTTKSSWINSPILWIGAGLVVAGATAAVVVMTRSSQEEPSRTGTLVIGGR